MSKEEAGPESRGILSFMSAVDGREDLGKWFVDLSLSEFEGCVDSGELNRIRDLLLDLASEDPFLQSKFDWLAGFLRKRTDES